MSKKITQTFTDVKPSYTGQKRLWDILSNRNFMLLWIAQLLSLTTLNAVNYGFVLLVGKETNSQVIISLAFIAFQIPAFPFGAIAGVIVEWLDKRLVLWLSNLLRVGTMLLMAFSLAFDRSKLWPLFFLIFFTSLIGQFFSPAESASIPLLVGNEQLAVALSLFNITLTLSMVIGFLLLGGLAAKIFPYLTLHFDGFTLYLQPTDMLFVFGAIMYFICTICILLIPHSAFKQNRNLEYSSDKSYTRWISVLKRLWTELIGGWNIVHSNPLLFFSVIQLSVIGIVMLLIGELTPSFVKTVLHRDPTTDMSIILAPAAVGLILAAIIMPRIIVHVNKHKLTIWGFAMLAVGFILLFLSPQIIIYFNPLYGSHSLLLLGITMSIVFILGVAVAVVNVPTQTMMIENTPEIGRARVFSLQFMFYNLGSIPILLFSALIAQFIGLNWIVFLISTSLLLFCIWGWMYVQHKS